MINKKLHRSNKDDSTEEDEQEKRRRLKEAQEQDDNDPESEDNGLKHKKKPSKLDLRSEDLETQAYASIFENLAVENDVSWSAYPSISFLMQEFVYPTPCSRH